MDSIKGNKLAILGLIGFGFNCYFGFIGPLLSDHDYAEQDVTRRNLPAKIPVLDKVPFLPFDGTGSDGTNAYKDLGVKENFWFGTDQLGRFMDTHMDWCSNFIVYRYSGCCIRYLYRSCLWGDIRFLWWSD